MASPSAHLSAFIPLLWAIGASFVLKPFQGWRDLASHFIRMVKCDCRDPGIAERDSGTAVLSPGPRSNSAYETENRAGWIIPGKP